MLFLPLLVHSLLTFSCYRKIGNCHSNEIKKEVDCNSHPLSLFKSRLVSSTRCSLFSIFFWTGYSYINSSISESSAIKSFNCSFTCIVCHFYKTETFRTSSKFVSDDLHELYFTVLLECFL